MFRTMTSTIKYYLPIDEFSLREGMFQDIDEDGNVTIVLTSGGVLESARY